MTRLRVTNAADGVDSRRHPSRQEAAGEAFQRRSCARISGFEKGLVQRIRVLEEPVQAERDQKEKETGRWSRVVEETERKMGLERIHQKESFGRWKLEIGGNWRNS